MPLMRAFAWLLLIFACGHALAQDIQAKEIKTGTGRAAGDGDLVTFHFLAKTPHGRTLADSEKRGMSYQMVLGEKKNPQLFELAVSGMKLGEIRQVTFPPAHAFGQKGVAPFVAPNTTIVLRIRLLKIEKPPQKGGR
jgi:FKBP-type peptidyl-prolyl cis-trans isomerase